MTTRHLTLLWAGLATTYALTSRGTYNVDLEATMVPAWSLANLATVYPPSEVVVDNPWFTEVDGKLASDRQPGAVLPLVPFYALARLLGFEAFSTGPGSLFAALTVAAGVILLIRTLSALVPSGAALSAGLVIGLASPVWTVAANGPWPHTVDVLAIAGGLAAMSRGRWWLAGGWMALLVPTRPLLAVAIAVIGVTAAVLERSIRPVVALGLPSMVGLLALLGWNRLVLGAWSLTAGSYNNSFAENLAGGRDLGDYMVTILGFTFSPDRGVVWWLPLAVVGVLASSRVWQNSDAWIKASALGALAYGLVHAQANRFWGGDYFYGPRYAIEPLLLATPLITLALWRLWLRSRRWRLALASLAGWQFTLHLIGAPQEPTLLVDGPWRTLSPAILLSDDPLLTAALGALGLTVWLLLLLRASQWRDATREDGPIVERSQPPPVGDGSRVVPQLADHIEAPRGRPGRG
jgi:hypothetical protein